MICADCGRKEAETGRDVCFRCRVASVGFSWHGGGYLYGRENFSSRTNGEFLSEHVGEIRDNPRYAPVETSCWT